MNLTPFSYVVLTLVGRGGATAHELAAMRDRGRLYWAAPRSQLYAEPKRLAEAGFLEATEEPGRTGPRTRYALTERGRKAVAAWVREPVGLPRIQHEAAVRVLAADLADDPADVLAGLAPLRDEIAAGRAMLAEGLEATENLPERRARLEAQHRMANRILDALEAWQDEVEALLRP
ncbi:MAG TPA: PadR family transcriptional regulator [Baekduia sp.]|nr:PadR family transcriptional regulator [Baekduia sp.]